MRGGDIKTESLFSYVSCEARVPLDHPLRQIRAIVDEALAVLSPEFATLYSPIGRPSISAGEVAAGAACPGLLFGMIRAPVDRATGLQPDVPLVRRPVDGCADLGRDGSDLAKATGRNAERDFRGEKRGNDTHASTTDPDARLYKKAQGQAAKLCHMGHLLMENRHGLIIDALLTHATGTAEREAALTMLERLEGRHRITLGADKAYDVVGFIAKLRKINITPHVAQNTANRRSAIDGRTTRHPGYAVSMRMRIRKRIEGGVRLDEDLWRHPQGPPLR